MGQAGSLRRVGNPPRRRLATVAQLAKLPHKGTSSPVAGLGVEWRTRTPYCFGPITGPVPTCTYPVGGCPPDLHALTAVAAVAFTPVTEEALSSCGATTAAQP